MGARFSAPVQTGPGAYPASYTMGTGTFPGVKRPGRDVDHPPTSSAEVEGRVELPLWTFGAGYRETFTFTFVVNMFYLVQSLHDPVLSVERLLRYVG